MLECPAFRIRYWGVTGTFARPLLPGELTDKIVQSMQHVSQQGLLENIGRHAADAEAIRQFVLQHVPSWLHSTAGGNTSCAELQTPDALIIVDAGSGFRELGIDLNRRWNAPDYEGPRAAHLLLTHAHMDHTFAAPVFDPFYDPRNHFRICGPQHALNSLHALLSPQSQFRTIYFPLTYEELAGIKGFQEIEAGDDFQIGGTRVTTYALHHPGGCVAYRFDRDGRSVVFASDHEHRHVPDAGLAAFAQGADLMYADGQYLQAEYEGRQGMGGQPPISRKGWGHSTVEAAIATALAAGVQHLHLGHHDPKRSDEHLDQLEQYARNVGRALLVEQGKPADACQVTLARESQTLEI
jgi:phosphoribosyl 1,2-cyclic phosphodiesterase